MARKQLPTATVKLEKIVGDGQTIATLEDGKKIFIWGGLPDETVTVQLTKNKATYAEGVVTEVLKPSPERVEPKDPESFLSTSPWQIMDFKAEQRYKQLLIDDAFVLHKVKLPNKIEVYTDQNTYEYRNKMEYSWWWTTETDQIDLAFFKRGSHSKLTLDKSSLAMSSISRAAINVRDLIRSKSSIKASMLKTLLIRSSQDNQIIAQLYVKDLDFPLFSQQEIDSLDIAGFEIIYSEPKSPASIITEVLQQRGISKLSDTILDKTFRYSPSGFFQVNIPVYEQALRDMSKFIDQSKPVVDLYSGVGSIGLTIGSDNLTMVEINDSAYEEMVENAKSTDGSATTILAPSEDAVEYITSDSTIIVDPPRAGLHEKVVNKILENEPRDVIYLSCNPVTQARDVAHLLEKYEIKHHKGYNFFPHTPHIENLVVLSLKAS